MTEKPKSDKAPNDEFTARNNVEQNDYPQPEPLDSGDISPTEAPPSYAQTVESQADDDGAYRGVPFELEDDDNDEAIITPIPVEEASWEPIIKWGLVAGALILLYLLFRKKD